MIAWWTLNRTKALILVLLLLAAPVAAQQPVQGTGTAGSAAGGVLTVQGSASGTPVPISGTITANLGTLNGLFLDATFTGRMPAGASPANGESNTSTSLSRIGGYNFIYNGSTWDRWTGAVSGTVTANMGTVTADPFGANADAASATGSISAKLRFIASTGIPITGTVTVGSHNVTNAGTFAVQPAANSTINVNQWNSASVASPDANSYILASGAATATTTAGTATCYITSGASTNSTSCKASAGNLYEIHVTNTTTTNYFLRVYNASSAPTCSSATGFVETVPALGAAANGGVNGRINTPPQAYSTGIGFCLTGGGSSTDNTNAATGVYVTLLYK